MWQILLCRPLEETTRKLGMTEWLSTLGKTLVDLSRFSSGWVINRGVALRGLGPRPQLKASSQPLEVSFHSLGRSVFNIFQYFKLANDTNKVSSTATAFRPPFQKSARKWSRNTSISRKIPRHGRGMVFRSHPSGVNLPRMCTSPRMHPQLCRRPKKCGVVSDWGPMGNHCAIHSLVVRQQFGDINPWNDQHTTSRI